MTLQIKDPCSKSWNNMTALEAGRYCSSCTTIVVDFTSMSEQEIMEYFQIHYAQKTCGHFSASQLSVQEKSLLLAI